MFRKEKADLELIADEHNPLFSLSDHELAFSHHPRDHGLRSYDGFFGHSEKQQQAAAAFSQLLGMHGRILDVGPGTNIDVALGFKSAGLESYTLDLQQAVESAEVETYAGDASALPTKALPSFQSIVYWGSWHSLGSSERSIVARLGTPSIEDYLYATGLSEKKMLDRSRKQLGVSGQIAIVSNRYSNAYGHLFEELAEEKESFLSLGRTLETLGASELVYVGVSAPALWRVAEEHRERYISSYKISRLSRDVSYDVDGKKLKFSSMSDAQKKRATFPTWSGDPLAEEGARKYDAVISALCSAGPLARIDAVVGRFM